eukprot:712980-Rhodomonas_salina.1
MIASPRPVNFPPLSSPIPSAFVYRVPPSPVNRYPLGFRVYQVIPGATPTPSVASSINGSAPAYYPPPSPARVPKIQSDLVFLDPSTSWVQPTNRNMQYPMQQPMQMQQMQMGGMQVRSRTPLAAQNSLLHPCHHSSERGSLRVAGVSRHATTDAAEAVPLHGSTAADASSGPSCSVAGPRSASSDGGNSGCRAAAAGCQRVERCARCVLCAEHARTGYGACRSGAGEAGLCGCWLRALRVCVCVSASEGAGSRKKKQTGVVMLKRML